MSETTTIVRIVEDEIDLTPVIADLTRPECGAVLSFLGVVRDHADGKSVESIEYTSYAEMAEKELRRVVEDAQQALGVPHVAVIHRVGHLAVGVASLGVVVASPHRKEAFACGLRIIDEMKKTVPIWKKEFGPDGSHWV